MLEIPLPEDYWDHARAIHDAVRLIQEAILGVFGARPGMGDLCPDLTFPQYNTLVAVHDAGECGVKHRAEQLHVAPPSASAMVDRLVEMRLLARNQNPADRRSVIMQLSPQGLSTLGAREGDILRLIVALIKELGEERVREWRAIHDSIVQILSRRNGTHPAETPAVSARGAQVK